MRLETAEGVELNVITTAPDAPGPPVVLVHGLASNARLWDGVAAHLAATAHPTAAVDQRGHGQSTKPDAGYDFATLTDDLRTVVDHLGWTKPWFAGQSWGANVVLELAARHPDAVGGLILVDGGTGDLADRFPDWPTCEAALAPPRLERTPREDFEKAVRAMHPDWPESGITGTLANVAVLPDGTIKPHLSRAHHMTILRHLWEHHPSTRYPDIHVPVLILPAEDPHNHRWMATKREAVEQAAKSLERSFTRWINGDHDLHAQHPDVVAELIHDATGPGLFSR